MQPPKSAICVICGSRPATTHDHVPPRGLFKGLSAQLITVPACSTCNNGASSDDEDLRFYISLKVGKQTPGSSALWDQGAHKSVKRKTSLREAIIATAREVRTTDALGNPVARLAVEVPTRIYQTVFERTTRGLYFYHTGRILTPHVPVIVKPITGIPNLDMPEFRSLKQCSIAGEACVYRFGITEEQRDGSLWLYGFYRTHWVMAVTGDATESTL